MYVCIYVCMRFRNFLVLTSDRCMRIRQQEFSAVIKQGNKAACSEHEQKACKWSDKIQAMPSWLKCMHTAAGLDDIEEDSRLAGSVDAVTGHAISLFGSETRAPWRTRRAGCYLLRL
jgi:hypothetical protein